MKDDDFRIPAYIETKFCLLFSVSNNQLNRIDGNAGELLSHVLLDSINRTGLTYMIQMVSPIGPGRSTIDAPFNLQRFHTFHCHYL